MTAPIKIAALINGDRLGPFPDSLPGNLVYLRVEASMRVCVLWKHARDTARPVRANCWLTAFLPVEQSPVDWHLKRTGQPAKENSFQLHSSSHPANQHPLNLRVNLLRSYHQGLEIFCSNTGEFNIEKLQLLEPYNLIFTLIKIIYGDFYIYYTFHLCRISGCSRV